LLEEFVRDVVRLFWETCGEDQERLVARPDMKGSAG